MGDRTCCFGRFLQEIEPRFPPPWTGTLLPYVSLVSQLELAAGAGKGSPQELHFWQVLDGQVIKASTHFSLTAAKFLGQANSWTSKVLGNLTLSKAVLWQAAWCFWYAKVNAAILHMTTSRVDQLFENKPGLTYLQDCWSRKGPAMVAFLHSPLIVEVKAFEERARLVVRRTSLHPCEPLIKMHLSNGYPCGTALPPCLPDTSASYSWRDSMMDLTNPSAGQGCCKPFDGQHFCCPICLETFYKPIALECGHLFCKPCLLNACLMHPVQTLVDLRLCKKACPTCRQLGVFPGAVRMNELEHLVRLRFPDECARSKQRLS